MDAPGALQMVAVEFDQGRARKLIGAEQRYGIGSLAEQIGGDRVVCNRLVNNVC